MSGFLEVTSYSSLSVPPFIPQLAMWKLQGGFRSVESSDGKPPGHIQSCGHRGESEYATPPSPTFRNLSHLHSWWLVLN